MSQTFKAGGNITPASFVKFSADNTVVLAGSGERVIGISAQWTRRVPGESTSPLSGLDDGYIAISGENVTVYTDGDKEVVLQIGTAVTAGQRVKSDTSGFGTPSTTDKDQYGGVARHAGAAGELIAVDVMIGEVSV